MINTSRNIWLNLERGKEFNKWWSFPIQILKLHGLLLLSYSFYKTRV